MTTTGPTNPGYGYSAPVESTPMPISDDPWTSTHPQNPSMTDSQLRQRVVHTQLFKLIEMDDGPQRRTELWISEADWMGRERLRHLEHFFNEIVGHVKDKWGHSIYEWREAVISGSKRCPMNFIKLKKQPTLLTTRMDDDEADDTSAMGHPPDTHEVPSVPLQNSQLAHLYDVLIQDPEFNAPILDVRQAPPQNPAESNVRLLTREGLAQLGSHLAINANIMAQSVGAEAEIPD